MSKGNGFFMVDKQAAQLFPVDRQYTELEALCSFEIDRNSNREWSYKGYAKLWGWDRNKVRRFITALLSKTGLERVRKRQFKIPVRVISSNKKQRPLSDPPAPPEKPDIPVVDKGQRPFNDPSATPTIKTKTNTKDIPEKSGYQFYRSKKGKKLSGETLSRFMTFWGTYNHKVGKADAADAWLQTDHLDDNIFESIIRGAGQEAERRPSLIEKGLTPKQAQGWLSGRRWEDETFSSSPLSPSQDCSNCKFQNTDVCQPPGPCINFQIKG